MSIERRYQLVRDTGECKAGEYVYEYFGHTYGCVADGLAVTKERGETPFFEVPWDSIVISLEVTND